MAINLDSLYWLVKERVKVLQGFNIHVSDATNSNPILIKTNTDHNYETGRHVNIDKVKGNTAANGSFFIRVTSPTEFELYKQVNSVQGATNTSPIVMTIVGHNFNTADKIRVQGIEGNTAANGIFYVKQQGVAVSNTVGTPVLTIDTFSNTDTIVITKVGHGLATGDRVQIFSPDGVAAINGIFYANVLTPNTYEIYRDATFITTVDGTALGAYEGDSTMQKYSSIVVTAVGHGFANKDAVKIIDIVGEPNAVGGFYVKVLSPNTFELYSDTVISVPVLGTGTYLYGGIAAPLNNYNLELYTHSSVFNVTGASNTTPIVVTAPGNNFANGSRVNIGEVGGNLAASGIFYINVIVPGSTFSLFMDSGLTVPVVGTGTYTAGGSAIQIDVPTSGSGTYLRGGTILSIPAAASQKIFLSNGLLKVGTVYTIENFETGDDFSNVANVIFPGVINTVGCKFVATGTTPNVWSNGSRLSYPTLYEGGGIVTNEIDIQGEFKDTFPEVPANIYESILKRIRS